MHGRRDFNYCLTESTKASMLYCLSLLNGELVFRAKFLHWGGTSCCPFGYAEPCLLHFYATLLCCLFFLLSVCMTFVQFYSMCSVQTMRWACLLSWCSLKLFCTCSQLDLVSSAVLHSSNVPSILVKVTVSKGKIQRFFDHVSIIVLLCSWDTFVMCPIPEMFNKFENNT